MSDKTHKALAIVAVAVSGAVGALAASDQLPHADQKLLTMALSVISALTAAFLKPAVGKKGADDAAQEGK